MKLPKAVASLKVAVAVASSLLITTASYVFLFGQWVMQWL